MGAMRNRMGARSQGFALVILVGLAALAAEAQAEPPAVKAPNPTAPQAAAAEAMGSWELRAQGMEAFLGRTLSPLRTPSEFLNIDATHALWSDLDGADLAMLLEAVAREVKQATPAKPSTWKGKPGAAVGAALATLGSPRMPPPRADARGRYIIAVRTYRAFSSVARTALHKAHRTARSAHLAEVEAGDQRRSVLAKLRKDIDNIAALTLGKLDPAVDVSVLLTVSLLPTGKEGGKTSPALLAARKALKDARLGFYAMPHATRDAAFALHRAKAKAIPSTAADKVVVAPAPASTPPIPPVSVPKPAPPAPAPPAPAGDVAPVTAATSPPQAGDPDSEEERLKALRAADAELAAQEASRQKALALAAAKLANTTLKRQVAEEQARLLGVKETQQKFKAELNRRTAVAKSFATEVAAWQKTLADLQKSQRLGDDVTAPADALYAQVAPAMELASERLTDALDAFAQETSEVPTVGGPPGDAVAATSKNAGLTALRSELVGAERELAEEEGRVRWEVAEVLQSELSNLGTVRNALLPLLGSSVRDRMTGFGAVGVEQVQREFSELQLLARYRLAAWPRTASKMLREAKTSPIPWLVYLLKVALLLFALRWWRKSGDALLGHLVQNVQKARRTSLAARVTAPVLWYFKRLQRPLVWLIFWAVFIDWTARAVRLPELEALWLIAKWVLFGQLIIGALDAFAARARRTGLDPLQELRFRSLRLVGLTIVVIGLLLALVERAVGEGAIYVWVLDLSLMLTLPIIWLLVRWWRPEVAKRAKMRHQENNVVAWIAENTAATGVLGWFAAGVGGLYLLLETLYRWLFQRLAFFDTTRKALAFLARRSSETQKQNRMGLSSIAAAMALTEDQEGGASQGIYVPTSVSGQADELAKIFDSKESAIVAIVGERGAGKTTFLNRALERSAATRTIRIRAQPEGYGSVKAALLKALDLNPEAELSAIAAEIQSRRPQVICIDQSHRIIRPEIGGLDGFDELVHLARSVGGGTCWAMVFNAPVWMHIKRARGHRAIFHSVTVLPAWSEEEVADLCMKRAAAAALEPNFEDLEIARLPDDDADADPAKRHMRGYFRMLWDYSGGNPSIALHFWSHSLFETESKTVVVRMFQSPNAAVLVDLPESVYFVLRAVIQREWASAEDVVSSTRFSREDVEDALAWARRGGLMESHMGRVRVDFQWYRSVATVLRRRHLLVG